MSSIAMPVTTLNGLAMITLGHLNSCCAQRKVRLLEELDMPHDINRCQRDADTRLTPPELRAIHPLEKSPVITDGALTTADLGALIAALTERYGQGLWVHGASTAERLRCAHWLHFAQGLAMPPLRKLILDKIEKSPRLFFVTPIAKGIAGKAKQSFIFPRSAKKSCWCNPLARGVQFAKPTPEPRPKTSIAI